jgi:hypothetical protein
MKSTEVSSVESSKIVDVEERVDLPGVVELRPSLPVHPLEVVPDEAEGVDGSRHIHSSPQGFEERTAFGFQVG